jgi:AraC-like DNA-binding protein
LEARGFAFDYLTRFHAIHLHDYHGRIRLEGQEYPLTPGTLTISPAGEHSSYDLPGPGLHWCIHFESGEAVRGVPRIMLPLVRELGPAQSEAGARFAWIHRLHGLSLRSAGASRRKAHAAAAVALQDLLLWHGLYDDIHLAAVDRPQASVDSAAHAVERLLDLIQQHLHQPVTAAQLAHQVGLSQNYLARLFRQHMGMTIPSYMLHKRIERAQQLLTSTNWPVKQVACRVGLPDAQHFNKQFRRITHASPTRWRQRGASL